MSTDQEKIGARLRSERERLGLSQEDMATRCGISRPTQYRYESGRASPDGGYINAAAAIGVNVQYVLIGAGVVPVKLSAKETALIDLFRLSPSSVQDAVIKLLKNQEKKPKAKPRKTVPTAQESVSVTQNVQGEKNTVMGSVQGNVTIK